LRKKKGLQNFQKRGKRGALEERRQTQHSVIQKYPF